MKYGAISISIYPYYSIQYNTYLSIQGTVSGSVQATDRLMKELRDIYKSPNFKNGAYQVILTMYGRSNVRTLHKCRKRLGFKNELDTDFQ